jgi:hypothetical protein
LCGTIRPIVAETSKNFLPFTIITPYGRLKPNAAESKKIPPKTPKTTQKITPARER